MKKYVLLLPVIVFILASCSPTDLDLGSDDFNMDIDMPPGAVFTVYDNSTEDPIEGASVYVEYIDTDGHSQSTTLTTNLNGLTEFIWEVYDVRYVEASAFGYNTVTFEDGNYINPIYLEPISE